MQQIMITIRTVLMFLALLVPVAVAEARDNALPADASRALESAKQIVLYSLEPWERPSKVEVTFHGYKVLGKTELDESHTATARGAFKSATAAWDGRIATCFDPRHALRIVSDGHVYDFLLCYACHQLEVYRDDAQVASIGATGSASVLNKLLADANVPASQSWSEDKEREQAARRTAAEKRWVDAIPKAIRPYWVTMTLPMGPDLAAIREAFEKEVGDEHTRILQLLEWYGSGAGPWSGFPAYEEVAEKLLLDYSTGDIVATVQSTNLDANQLEGAARLVGGWTFHQKRPADAGLIPTALKKKLLEHVLQTPLNPAEYTHQDRIDRATRAFGG
ncbi:hypothetical protein [Dokdonella soli]|uniref:Cytochrome c domain-containing protein n=1 Tax=Dokdonella soli TaxID=529810 RepID=A0ABN1IMZ3_9GAMM